MKHFDSKWQECAARARQAPPRDQAPPFGFAARVAALTARPEGVSDEMLWMGFILRFLSGVLALLILCAAWELPHLDDRHPLAPGIENTVAQILWSL